MSNPRSLKDRMDLLEKQVIIEELEKNRWNISKVAILLNVSRGNFHRKMSILGIKRPKKVVPAEEVSCAICGCKCPKETHQWSI